MVEIAQDQPPAVSVQKAPIVGIALALFFSPNAFLVLAYGLIGASVPAFTAAFYVGCLTLIFALTIRRASMIAPDWLYLAFLCCVAVSFALNGGPAGDYKEAALMALTLAAYPACRLVSGAVLDKAMPAFIAASAAIVLIGSIASVLALVDQWSSMHGKPSVFGYDSATTHFLLSLGLILIALATRPLSRAQTAATCLLAIVPATIFAISLVRFTFIAILGSLALAAIFSTSRQRLHIACVAAVIVASILIGLTPRTHMTKRLINFDGNEVAAIVKNHQERDRTPSRLGSTENITPPTCRLNVDMMNSIAMRQALLSDSVYLLPKAGWFGFGLGGFTRYTCMRGFVPHNGFLQAGIEIGWLGGLALVALVGAVGARLVPLARLRDPSAQFVLCSLACAAALSAAHGRLSREMLLFGLAGLAASKLEEHQRPKAC